MRALIQLIKKFRKDEEGAFLALFGVMAIVLTALSGAGIDFVTLEQARTRAQAALDAATLSLQPSIYTLTEAQLGVKALALVKQQVNDSQITIIMQDVDTNQDEGMIYFEALMTVPTTFVSLVGVDEISALVISQATRKNIFVEVAMVLDNSGSMGQSSRMINLKAAAKNATDILFNYENTSENTRIAIVPFNFWVNVGASNKNETWLDQNGLSGISGDNFDQSNVNRFDLYDEISNVSWAGCVEARVQPYDVDDTEPSTSSPNTLFTPTFAPDEPDYRDPPGNYNTLSYDNDYLDDDPASCVAELFCEWTQTSYGCNHEGNYCNSSDETFTATDPNTGSVTTGPSACSCNGSVIIDDDTTTTRDGTRWINWYGHWREVSAYKAVRVRTCNNTSSVIDSLSERQRQERICKYTGSTASLGGGSWGSNLFGPNADCVSTELLPLSNNRPAIKARIDSMTSDGATNIHQGAIWGFHALSPTEPFTEGREYDTATSKIVILMTDGQNTYYKDNGSSTNLNGTSYFAPYGYPYNERLGNMSKSGNQMAALVDGRLLETCDNIKLAGIKIFTIGLEPPAGMEALLTECASGDDHAYFPTNSSALDSVFSSIAGQLSDLRLSQ